MNNTTHEANQGKSQFFAETKLKSSSTTHTPIDILINCLEEHFNVVLTPKNASRSFAWVRPIYKKNELEDIDEFDMHSIYVCFPDVAYDVIQASGIAFLLILNKDGSDLPDFILNNRERVIVIEKTDRLIYVTQLILRLFGAIATWDRELERIVMQKGTLQDLLNIGSQIMESFTCITDSGFSLIAKTSKIAPQEDNIAYNYLVDNKCFSEKEIDHLNSSIVNFRQKIYIDKPHDECPQSVLHCPIYFDGQLFFLVSSICESLSPTKTEQDFFKMLCNYVEKLCKSLWENIIRCESPWHIVLTNLIENVSMKEKYIEAQLKNTSVLDATKYRLLIIDITDCDDLITQRKIIEASKKLNDGHSLPFVYNNRLVILLYDLSESDVSLSPNRTQSEIIEHFYNPYGVYAAASRVFHNIFDLRFAYLQAHFVTTVVYALDAERELAKFSVARAYYSFEQAYPYYLLINSSSLTSFNNFCSHDTLIQKLAEEDKNHGSELVCLLWTYICFEHNATAVSKQLHLHRNTILYHIDKIQKRFGFDLDDPLIRNKLLIDFYIYFITNKHTSDIPHFDTSSLPPSTDVRRIV